MKADSLTPSQASRVQVGGRIRTPLRTQFVQDCHGEKYRPADAARLLRISRTSLYRYIDSGRIIAVIDAIRRYKIPKSEIARFLSERGTVACHIRPMIEPRAGLNAHLWKKQDGRCWYCCGTLLPRFNRDHIHPRSRGGKNVASNYCLACESCNQKKSATSSTDFVIQLLVCPRA